MMMRPPLLPLVSVTLVPRIVAEVGLHLLEVGIDRVGARGGLGRCRARATDELLCGTDGQVPFEHDAQQFVLLSGGGAAQGAGVALADEALRDGVLDRLARVEQAHRVGDARTGAADLLGDLLLGQPELAHEAPEGARFLERVEVGPLDVLDEGQLQLLAVGCGAPDDGRDAREAGEARGAAGVARRR